MSPRLLLKGKRKLIIRWHPDLLLWIKPIVYINCIYNCLTWTEENNMESRGRKERAKESEICALLWFWSVIKHNIFKVVKYDANMCYSSSKISTLCQFLWFCCKWNLSALQRSHRTLCHILKSQLTLKLTISFCFFGGFFDCPVLDRKIYCR